LLLSGAAAGLSHSGHPEWLKDCFGLVRDRRGERLSRAITSLPRLAGLAKQKHTGE
jgi:hypothetical protein